MARERKILEAAARLFAERGFSAIGVDEIGSEAGVSGPAVYRHFSGKDEILATLYDEAIDGILQATSGSFDVPDDELRFKARAHSAYVLKERRLASVWILEARALSATYRRQLHRRESRYVESWLDCIRRCYPGVDATLAQKITHAALGTLNSVALWPPVELGDARLPDILADFVVAGIERAATERAATTT